MSRDPLHELGVAALGRALRSRELSSVEATRHLLDRLAGHERLGVALALAPEAALAQAKAADARLAAGEAGPLIGVPIAHKDIFVTRELPTSRRSNRPGRWSRPMGCAPGRTRCSRCSSPSRTRRS